MSQPPKPRTIMALVAANERIMAAPKGNPVGRPTSYTDKLAGSICVRLAGGESLRSICSDDGMPHISTVLLWVVNDREGFSEQYHRAREAAGYSHADEALALRHELREGTLEPQVAKVILDALKWGAERMSPKRHSPRQELTGPEGGPVEQRHGIDASSLSDSALAELMNARRDNPQ